MNSPHTPLQTNHTHKNSSRDINFTDWSTNVSLYCTNNSHHQNTEFNEINPPHLRYISLQSKMPKQFNSKLEIPDPKKHQKNSSFLEGISNFCRCVEIEQDITRESSKNCSSARVDLSHLMHKKKESKTGGSKPSLTPINSLVNLLDD